MSLIDFIRDKELSSELFTVAERDIIQKQLQGISLTQSQKNVLSRKIRKKLIAIKECALFENEFRVKKGQYSEQILEHVVSELRNNEKIARIYVFGSYLTQQFSSDSDIDVAVEFRNICEKDATIFLKNTYPLVDEIIDLTVLNTLPVKIQHQVREYGRIIYENS